MDEDARHVRRASWQASISSLQSAREHSLAEMDAGMDAGDYTFALDIPPDFNATSWLAVAGDSTEC